MLGIEGFQQVLLNKAARPASDCVSEELLRDIQRFRNGPAEDDILIVELCRGRTERVTAPEEVTSR
jgi:hypothetical protein